MCRRCKEVEPTGGLERVGGVDSVFKRPRVIGTCSTGRVEDVYRHKLDGGVGIVKGTESWFRPKPDTGTCSTGGSRGRGKKEITKYPWEIEMEEQQAIDDCTCPVCGYYSPLNGGLYKTVWGFFHDKEYELYECKECGCQWQIRIR